MVLFGQHFFLAGLRGAGGLQYVCPTQARSLAGWQLSLGGWREGYKGWQCSGVRDSSWWTGFCELSNFPPSPLHKLSWGLVHGAALGQPSKNQFAEINSNWLALYQRFRERLICLHPCSLLLQAKKQWEGIMKDRERRGLRVKEGCWWAKREGARGQRGGYRGRWGAEGTWQDWGAESRFWAVWDSSSLISVTRDPSFWTFQALQGHLGDSGGGNMKA